MCEPVELADESLTVAASNVWPQAANGSNTMAASFLIV